MNFLESAPQHTPEETALANNLIAYLAAPVALSSMIVPTLSEWGMLLLFGLLGLTAVFGLRRKLA